MLVAIQLVLCALAFAFAFASGAPFAGNVNSYWKISPVSQNIVNAKFGHSSTSLGDLDGDTITDIVFGEPNSGTGAIYILFLNANKSVKSEQKIDYLPGNLFGSSLSNVGDLNGDKITDIAVGAAGDGDGTVYILFLNKNGTVRGQQKISGADFGALTVVNNFGRSVSTLGDLNKDGIPDIAVGDDRALWILFLNANGTVKSYNNIGVSGGSFVSFGSSVALLGDLNKDGVQAIAVGASTYGQNGKDRVLGDLNGDGIADIAVGAPEDDDGGVNIAQRGAMWVLFLKGDGTVLSYQKTSSTQGNFSGIIADHDNFGVSLSTLHSDFNSSGIPDIAVGAEGDGGRGAVYIISLTSGDAPPTTISSTTTMTVTTSDASSTRSSLVAVKQACMADTLIVAAVIAWL